MTAGDAPVPYQPSKHAEVQAAQSADSSRSMLDEIALEPGTKGGKQILNHGQIANMKLPDGWLEMTPQEQVTGDSLLRRFEPSDQDDVMLCLYFRGGPMSSQASQRFHELISQSPHQLSATELQGSTELLQHRGDPKHFTVKSASTGDLNGKRVLVIEGTFIPDHVSTLAMFVDADGSGKFAQEVFYQSPDNLYEKYKNTAKASMHSIVWKSKPPSVLD